MSATEPTEPRKDGGRIPLILCAIVLAWIGYMIFFAPNAGRDLAPPDLRNAAKPGLGKPQAAYDWSLADLDGNRVDFRQYKGKTVFLNFWATWCGPCVQEMPSINSLASNSRLKDVVFLGVATDGEPPELRAFAESHRLKMKVIRPAESVPEVFVTEGIPATFLIGPTGEIALAHVGSAQWDAPEVVDLLEGLTRQGPAKP